MSHFLVGVFSHDTEDVDELLAPYNEGNEEYLAMLRKVEDNQDADAYFLYEIAKDIMEHSQMKNDETIEIIMSELALHSHMIYTIEEE